MKMLSLKNPFHYYKFNLTPTNSCLFILDSVSVNKNKTGDSYGCWFI